MLYKKSVFLKKRSFFALDYMKWQDFIHSDPNILLGKPTIKGTRLSVEFLIERLAAGWSEQDLLDNYPSLTKIHLQAIFLYVLEGIHDGLLYVSTTK